MSIASNDTENIKAKPANGMTRRRTSNQQPASRRYQAEAIISQDPAGILSAGVFY